MNVECPRCNSVKRVSKNVGVVECYCGYIYEVEE
jgi:transcription elongation factor Elf1